MQPMNPAAGQQPSALQQYMANYGSHLQSLLNAPTDTSIVGIQQPAPASALAAKSPQGGSATPYALPAQPQAQPQGPAPRGPAPQQPQLGSQADTDFRKRWKETPPEQQKEYVDKLENSLAQGNQTIDQAYDGLVQQLGAPPAPDQSLTREEKGMFLMEFGLSLMANSSGQAYGNDLGGAIGASGMSALQGHRARRGRARERYEDSRLEIEKGRAGAKARLAEQSALEARAEARDDRRQSREDSQLAGVVYGDDNTVYGYTRGGDISALEQPGGKTVKSRPPATGAGARGGRGFESDRRYQMFMDTYGKDASGAPLEGEALEQVKKRALAFSADPKAATMSEAEMRSMAERSADAFMKSNWSLFRDMTPDQAQQWRSKTADTNYERLKDGRDIDLQPPKPKPTQSPGGGSALARPRGAPKPAATAPKAMKSFKTPAEAEAALARKEISPGDVVMVGGRRAQVQ